MSTITPAEKAGGAQALDIEKHDTPPVSEHAQDEKSDSEDGSVHKQHGVKRVEGVTSVLSKQTMWIMFALLYLVAFVDMLIVSVQSNLNAYVTSAFYGHGLLAVTSIVATILGGSSTFTIAKIIDVWGRVEGFLAMVVITLIGLIMKAVCKNVATYAAAHTFYWVGHLGVIYVIDIILADMTTLRNRMIMLTLNGTPTIATTFAGPKIAERFYNEVNFRWAFGAFAIILVGICIPSAMLLIWNQRKAYKLGVLQKHQSGRTTFQSIAHYLVEFDIIGIILITAAFSLLLLPFNLVQSAGNNWHSASIICMFVFGALSLVAFVAWEKWGAPVQFFPFRYLKDRTIIGACLIYGFMFISIFTWDTYYYSYLQVVHDQTIANSGYILNAFSLTSSFISPFIGYLIRIYGNFKHICYGGIPFFVLGTALLIHFRTPESSVGYLVMCQVFNGVGTGIFATCAQIAIMASVTHQEIAVAIALWNMFGSIGAAIGQAIAGALWTNILPDQLYQALPEDSKNLTMTIYSSFVIQQDYPMGSPIRDAIIVAYADVQRKMVIAGCAFLPPVIIAVFMWKNINVKKLEKENGKQTKGTVW